ncbi:MAG: hypothetical protein LBI34_02640 [Puniceicoccales bacterium]|nr:hypothetical protein [Puniceicoccales bacterium]
MVNGYLVGLQMDGGAVDVNLGTRPRMDMPEDGSNPNAVFDVRTTAFRVCRCSKSDMEAIQEEVTRLCPERAELLRDMVARLVIEGLNADDIRGRMKGEVARMEPDVLRERQERASRIWDGECGANFVPRTDFEERLLREREAVGDMTRDLNARKVRVETTKVEADESQQRAIRAKAELDAIRAAAAETRQIPLPAEIGEKKKFGLLTGVRRFLG